VRVPAVLNLKLFTANPAIPELFKTLFHIVSYPNYICFGNIAEPI